MAKIPAVRAALLAAAAAIPLFACQFDPGGAGGGATDDDPTDGTPSADAASTPVTDASSPPPPPDAAPSSPDALAPDPLTCGGQTCAAGTICCVDLSGGGLATCVPQEDCDATGLTCDEPSDCPGEDCCLYGGLGSTCSPTCIGGDQVCDDASDCTSPGAGMCCPTQLGPSVCRPVCL